MKPKNRLSDFKWLIEFANQVSRGNKAVLLDMSILSVDPLDTVAQQVK